MNLYRQVIYAPSNVTNHLQTKVPVTFESVHKQTLLRVSFVCATFFLSHFSLFENTGKSNDFRGQKSPYFWPLLIICNYVRADVEIQEHKMVP